jgi:hypothetical protein
MLASWPNACSDAPRANATRSWLSTEPVSTYTILRGSVAIVSGQPRYAAGAAGRGQWPAAAAAGSP